RLGQGVHEIVEAVDQPAHPGLSASSREQLIALEGCGHRHSIRELSPDRPPRHPLGSLMPAAKAKTNHLSLPRYLVTRVVIPGIRVNVVVTAAPGAGAHAPGRATPLGGAGGIAGDTLANAVIIGFLPLLGVSLGARQEARAGRVRGLGHPSDGWLGFP